MEKLKTVFGKLNIEITDEKINQLNGYMDEILRLNEHINLTAITDRDEFIQKHYIDSVIPADSKEFLSAETIIDVGTGGGFPGVPLAIAFPDKKFVLMDSLNKRIKIIRELCDQLGINNVEAVHGRAEELARKKEYREAFDLCVSRAVANMSTLSEYCIPFIKKGGALIAYKGPDCKQEIDAAAKAIKVLGGGKYWIYTPKMEEFTLNHNLVFIPKISNTPKAYPRKAGTPAKEPIK